MSSSTDSAADSATSPLPADRVPPEVVPSAAGSEVEALPEYEPLTPELVEDEAVRGDFVIRWATVLLALMLGWTQVDDTSLLVRIRNGGGHPLPFGTDTLSATAGDRNWVNLAWLSDPILAGIYRIGGARGLTVLGALTAAAAFWCLSKVSRKGVSTWWSSACAAAAIVAVFPQLTPGPTGLTLLGVTLICWQLHRWGEDAAAGMTWRIPALVWIWAQLDTRGWVGAALVLTYAASWIGLRGVENEDAPGKSSALAKMAGWSLVALLIHPSHLHSLLAPWTAFAIEYPELREYKVNDWPSAWQWYSLASEEFRPLANQFAWTGIGLCATALCMMGLNFRRLAWEWALPWVVILGLAVGCGHFLPLAALLSCVVAGINGQRWYQATFSQSYTTDILPLLWNRGGRALTVMGMLLLGLVASNGMLMGRDGRRIGAGFSPLLKANIDSSEKIAKECYSPEIFNFRIEQGDVLIWAGLKPFVDRRLSLYAQGDENLLQLHRNLRPALLKPKGLLRDRDKPDLWKPVFDKYKIRHAVPRLSGPNPDYVTLVEMLRPEWTLSSVQAAGALLSRTEAAGDAAYASFLKEHPAVDFIKDTFRTPVSELQTLNVQWLWPRKVTVYDQYLWRPQTTLNEALQLATHEQQLVELLAQDPNTIPTTTALALSAYRHSRSGIILDPQSAEGYRIMARAALHLHRVDATLAGSFRANYQERFWLSQAMAALHHALKIDPHNRFDHAELANLALQQQQVDLSRRHLLEVYRVSGQYTLINSSVEGFQEAEEQSKKTLDEMNKHINQVETQVRDQMKQGAARIELVGFALQAQCPLLALKLIEEDKTVLAKSFDLRMIHAELLVVTGRLEEGLSSIGSLVGMLPKRGREAAMPSASELRGDYALASLAIGDNAEAELLWETEADMILTRSTLELLGSFLTEAHPAWAKDFVQPASLTLHSYQSLTVVPDRWASVQFVMAQSEMSTGRNSAAQKRLEMILENEPTTSLRSLVEFYLALLTGKSLSAAPANTVPQVPASSSTPAPATSDGAAVVKPAAVTPSAPETQPPATPAKESDVIPVSPSTEAAPGKIP